MKFVDLAVTTDARGHLFLAGYNYTWLGAAVQTFFSSFFSFLFFWVTCRTCVCSRMAAAAMLDGFSFKSEFSGVVVS